MKSPKRHPILQTLALCFLFTGSTLLSQDWNQYRGTHRDGMAPGFQVPSTWPDKLNPVWKVTVGDGVASPILADGRLVVFSREGSQEVIRCLNAQNGQEIWKDQYATEGADGPAGRFSGPRATPLLADGRLITFGVRGILSCLDAKTGKVEWRKDTSNNLPRFFTSCSPMVSGDLCIIQLGGESSGSIKAFRLQDGEEAWSWSGDGTAYASPVSMELGGKSLIIALTASKVVGLDASSGALVWETDFAVQGRGYNAATPIVQGNTLIYSGSNRGSFAIELQSQDGKVTANRLWDNRDGSVQYNSPVLSHDLVLGLSAQDELFAIHAKTGETAWKTPVAKVVEAEGNQGQRGGGRGMGRGGYGNILVSGSTAMVVTPASELIVFDVSAEGYQEKARIKVADSPVYAFPIAVGDRLIIKDQDSIMALALK